MNTMARTLQILTGQVKPLNIGVLAVKHICEDDAVLEKSIALSEKMKSISNERSKKVFEENSLKIRNALSAPKDMAQLVAETGLGKTAVTIAMDSMINLGIVERKRKPSGVLSYVYQLTGAD